MRLWRIWPISVPLALLVLASRMAAPSAVAQTSFPKPYTPTPVQLAATPQPFFSIEPSLSSAGVSLSSSMNPSNIGGSVTFTAAVNCLGFTPTGTTTFSDGATTLVALPLNGAFVSFATSALSAGPHKIIAAYSGDTNCEPATGEVLQSVNGQSAGPPPSSLDQFITQTMAANQIPGLAALVIRNGKVTFANGYGLADVSRGIPVTPDTDFLISSCSKTLGAVTLMQLYDQGRFGLDDDINRYLPFNARNPNYPQTPITFRQLLTHTSSLAMDAEDDSTKPGDPTVPLATFFRSFFTPDTPYYSDANFLNSAPGTFYEYSNEGSALWAYLAEAISGQPFYQLSQQSLISRLGMTNTSWRIADIDQSRLAIQYDQEGGALVPVAPFSYIEYPSGSIRTSVNQLAKFLIMFMNGGVYNGVRILSQQSVAEMQRRQVPQLDNEQGLAWMYQTTGSNLVLGHAGEDTGSGCYMFYRPSDNTGVIFLMNLRYNENVGELIASRLFDFASTGR
jgi:CubicO group peptidase (beta-lactamase class C family)